MSTIVLGRLVVILTVRTRSIIINCDEMLLAPPPQGDKTAGWTRKRD